MKTMALFFSFLLIRTGWPPVAGQTIRVDLPRLTPLDHDIHLTVFSSSPEERLSLPPVDTTGAGFFKVFYSRKISDDPELGAMVIPGPAGETIYIDLNNNEDLRDDGKPFFFPYKQNALSFDLAPPADPRQRVRILLERTPQVPDSALGKFVDENGNLNPRFARFWGGMKGTPSYNGTRGTFYFDSRVTVRRGQLAIGKDTCEIGLFDYSNNGLFNDDDDILLVDLAGDGFLTYPDDAVALNGVFTYNGINLKLSAVDKYGASIELQATGDPPTPFLDRHIR